jgi:hypothetical protein
MTGRAGDRPFLDRNATEMTSDDFPYGEHQPEDVLDTGLPVPPRVLAPGAWFPLAAWQDDQHGAVLYVYRNHPDDFDDPVDEYAEEVEILRRGPGGWEDGGSGGGNFADPFGEAVRRNVAGFTGLTGDGSVRVLGGVCAPQVGWVAVKQHGRTQRQPVDTPAHAFLVGVHTPPAALVRLLDHHGMPVCWPDGRPVEYPVP